MSLPNRLDGDLALPGSIRAVIPHPMGGAIAMAGFPGLETSIDGSAVFLPEECRETLQGLADLGATSLTLLVESDELDEAFIPALLAMANEVGIGVERLPIVDYSVPTEAQIQAWANGKTHRLAAFERGTTYAFACQYGAGRSGLMAARSLIEGGMTPDDAIALVRHHFSEAIESDAQEDWLKADG
ncbi:hypothetical protein [Gymnodinialimonas hymeniacidonis]|uniref:hypothetical protein n=1 Tax=Gymnodinialimonas hymeniacidonis TaxID=3126508 RepID=UPI0034C6BFB4